MSQGLSKAALVPPVRALSSQPHHGRMRSQNTGSQRTRPCQRPTPFPSWNTLPRGSRHKPAVARAPPPLSIPQIHWSQARRAVWAADTSPLLTGVCLAPGVVNNLQRHIQVRLGLRLIPRPWTLQTRHCLEARTLDFRHSTSLWSTSDHCPPPHCHQPRHSHRATHDTTLTHGLLC